MRFGQRSPGTATSSSGSSSLPPPSPLLATTMACSPAARAAVDALIDDTPAEDLDPEVDATRADLRRDAYLHAVAEGVVIDPAERLDLELRALLEAAEAGEVAPDEETGH